MLRDILVFLWTFLRHPLSVSSILPTSRVGVRVVAGHVDGSKAHTIVEYGPGTGGVAKALLEAGKLTPRSRVILIEKTPELAAYLQETITDSRVTVVHGDAQNVDTILKGLGIHKVDVVLSSIPLTLIPPPIRDTIIQKTRILLGSDGVFIVYLFRPVVEQFLRPYFPHIQKSRVWWCVPPLILFEARAT